MKFLRNNLTIKSLLFLCIIAFVSCSKDSDEPTPEETVITVETSDFSKTIDENPSSDQVIGTVQGSTNEGSITFSIVEQTPPNSFSINASSGELKVADASLFDFETNPVISGTVKVTNGAVSKNASIKITLNDINEENIYDGDVLLKSQEEVNSFGANQYSKINGSLEIGNREEESTTNISDLSPLESVNTITGNLKIMRNPNLTSTIGLSAHKIDGKLAIYNNSSLKKIEGFNNLTSVLDLGIANNDVLKDLSGLNQLTSIENNIDILSCPVMPNLDWLSNLITIGSNLNIKYCTAITNIDGLINLRNLTGEYRFFNISNNTSLKDLNGLRNLNTTIFRLELSDNLSLSNIEGLENINVTNTLSIYANQAIENLNGLESITSLSDELYIKGNNSLIDIQGLRNMHFSFYTEIFNNESLPNLEGLNNLSESWTLDIRSNSQLSNFCALTHLFSIVPPTIYNTGYNAYNPTEQDIIEGNCSL